MTDPNIIEEVRAGLNPEDIEGEKRLYVINGQGIYIGFGLKTWVVNAHSSREAFFIVFSLGTEFYQDVMKGWYKERVYPRIWSLATEVLDFEDGSCWCCDEVIDNCILETSSYTKSVDKQ